MNLSIMQHLNRWTEHYQWTSHSYNFLHYHIDKIEDAAYIYVFFPDWMFLEWIQSSLQKQLCHNLIKSSYNLHYRNQIQQMKPMRVMLHCQRFSIKKKTLNLILAHGKSLHEPQNS